MNESKSMQTLPGPDFAPMPAPPAHTHEEDAFEIFKRIHRLLRGRYAIAISLATVLAAAGAVGGWMLTVPKYTSVGMIRIKTNQPYVVYPLDRENPIQLNPFAKSQANLIQEPRVIDSAFRSDEWKALQRGIDLDDKDKFRASLRVDTRYDEPEWIFVRFTDADPKAAQVAVKAIITSYRAVHGVTELFMSSATVGELVNRIRTKEAEIVQERLRVRDIVASAPSTDIEAAYRTLLERFKESDDICNQLDARVKRAEQAEESAKSGTASPPETADPEYIIEEIAKADERLRPLLMARTSAKGYRDSLLARGLRPGHRSVQLAEAGLGSAQKQIDDFVEQYLAQHPAVGSGSTGAAVLSPDAKAALLANQKTYLDEREDLRKRMFELDEKRRLIAEINERIKKLQAQLADIERRHTILTAEFKSTDPESLIQIISDGDLPHRPSMDSRRKLAGFGFMLGAGLPFAACLLWGLLDRRFRYAEDASSGRLHPTLLGILPYLPENLTDPEQAAIAAHCVHQIRTLLQIAAAHQDRRVFTVTSPTSGDGKTSLTLSLALSFASSGANTCMIDFDMIGGGLTAAMNAKTDKGLFDAIDRGELNGHIRATSFKRLSLIPVGLNDAHEISRLSPEVVARVIDQARERFDVVVIDTGPILGSIEAPLVCSESDGVILTIGHGQGRPQADRAMESLLNVGATLLGVVFNRAQPGDFRRAVSSASVRSVSNQTAAADARALPAFGPMARTVASQSSMNTEAPADEH